MGMAEERAIDWLRKGATLLSESCPVCYSPLLKLRDKIWCPKCDRRVVVVEKEEEASDLAASFTMIEVGDVVTGKVREILDQIKEEKDVDRLQRLSNLLSTLIGILERVREARRGS